MFNDEDIIFQYRAQQLHDSGPTARLYCAGPALTCTGGHGTEYAGLPTRLVNSPAEARAQVRALAARRPDVVKVIYDHAAGSAFPSMDRTTMAACLATARQLGLRTVVHVGSWQDVTEALQAGASAITHVPREPLPPAVASVFVKSGAYFIPALAVQLGLDDLIRRPASDSLWQHLASPGLRRAYQDSAHFDAGTRWLRWQRRHRAEVLRSVAALHQAGVPLLTGTDAGNVGTLHGYSLHQELALLGQAGLSPWQVLAATSLRAGQFLGQHWGIEPGDEANFLVLPCSPLTTPGAYAQPLLLIRAGQVVDRAHLLPPAPAGSP